MINYVNVLDKGLGDLMGSLYNHKELRNTVSKLFNREIVNSISWADDTDITNMNLFTLEDGTTIDIITMVELGTIYIYINREDWANTLFLEWNGVEQKIEKLI